MLCLLRRVTATLAVLVLCLYAPGCEVNPTTGRSQVNFLSRDEEINIGASAMPELTKEYGGRVANADLQNYVTSIGRQLADQTEADNPSLPWEFTLLDSDVINAFALPGGKVFVSRGLAEKMTNEAQLAGVLGHEVGHVTARHTSERMTQQLGAGVAATVAGVVIGQVSDNDTLKVAAPIALAIGSQVVVLSFSRDQELEADALGMRYMTKLGYDPAGQMQVMQILAKESGGGGRGGGVEQLFATHPDPQARVDRIAKKLQGEYAYTQGNPQYQLQPERFRQQFLAKLPPPKPKNGKKAEFEPGRTFDLSGRATWCLVCAGNADAEQQPHAAPIVAHANP